MIDNLKPCPFCGGKADVGELTRDDPDEVIECRIQCQRCGMGGSAWAAFIGSTADLIRREAARAWNRRTCECMTAAKEPPVADWEKYTR